MHYVRRSDTRDATVAHYEIVLLLYTTNLPYLGELDGQFACQIPQTVQWKWVKSTILYGRRDAFHFFSDKPLPEFTLICL